MFKKIMIAALCLISALTIAWFSISWLGKQELQKQRQTFLDAGGILDAELFAEPAIADKVNAALAYAPIIEFLRTVPYQETNLLGDKDMVDDPVLHALLIKCQPIIDSLHHATAMRECWWDIQYDAGFQNIGLPHELQVKVMARLLASNIHVNAAQAQELNQNRDALITRDIEAILRLALHAAQDSTLLGQIAANVLLQRGLQLYEEHFSTRPAPPNKITKILAARLDHRVIFSRALRAEVLFYQSVVDEMQRDGTLFDAYSWRGVLFVDWDRAFNLRSMQAALVEAEKPLYEAGPMLESPWYAYTSRYLTPSFDPVQMAFAKTQLKIELLKTAEKLRTYKTQHGTYPEPNANPIKMPTDPVTGKLIRYETINDGQGFKLTGLIGIPDEDEVQWIWEK